MAMRLLFILLLAVLPMCPLRADDEEHQLEETLSPNRLFTVAETVITHEWGKTSSYAIRFRPTGKTLATCPDDGRYQSSPQTTLWNGNSRLVAVGAHTVRHGGSFDLWWVTPRKAELLKVDLAKEDGDIYVTPQKWSDRQTLECDAVGRTSSAHRRLHPDDLWVAYRLVVRVDPDTLKTQVSRYPRK